MSASDPPESRHRIKVRILLAGAIEPLKPRFVREKGVLTAAEFRAEKRLLADVAVEAEAPAQRLRSDRPTTSGQD